jgi:hypothetical protein
MNAHVSVELMIGGGQVTNHQPIEIGTSHYRSNDHYQNQRHDGYGHFLHQ